MVRSLSMPYLSDPNLVPRVEQYLEANLDKTYIDISVMADELQRTYREYANRKRSAFRASVSKAYSIVLDSYCDRNSSSNEEETVESEDSNTDNPELSQSNSPQDNSVNNQLVDLYNRNSVLSNMEESELIDISSDDSQGSPPAPVFAQQKVVVPYEKPTYDPRYEQTYKQESKQEQDSDSQRGKKRKLEPAPKPPTVAIYEPKRRRGVGIIETDCKYTFSDIGGMDKTLEEVCKLVLHMNHPELYITLGVPAPRGFLLHGPPGCGKTMLGIAVAGEMGFPLLRVVGPELVVGVSGGSEERIRTLFQEAIEIAPCVLFIDEIDAITPNRQNAPKEMEKRIVAQMLSCLDELNHQEGGNRVFVIGATSRPDSIDPALRRAGRFDREISLGIPDRTSRAAIIKILTKTLKLSENFDYDQLASLTPGYVGADLLALTREAILCVVDRYLPTVKDTHLMPLIPKDLHPAGFTSVKPGSAINYMKLKKAELIAREKEAELAREKEAQLAREKEAQMAVEKEAQKALEESKSVNGNADSDVLVIDEAAMNNPPVEKGPEETPTSSTAEEAVKVETKSTFYDLRMWLHNMLPLPERHLRNLCITMEDFQEALKLVQPSSKREGFATVPNTTWDDVGSLKDIREELQLSIVAPVRHSSQFEALGITVPAGVLLCGPPGCGKTLLAKAIANEAGINFISVKGPELLNMYVGESERAVRVCFERARNSSPCVIFFDELDALCPKRGSGGQSSPTMRVVNQLLTEMDGVSGRKGVFILAASNRPDIIDPAILRPGRLDKILFVGLPSANDRADILRAITKNGTAPKLASDVDLEWIATSEECSGYTGADLAALVREAGVLALKDLLQNQNITESPSVSLEHFKRAFSKIRPSVPQKDRENYEKLRKMYSSLTKDREEEDMELS